MYKLHLILKYLRKRRIAWVSLIAVMLCTAMVLTVLSVMGGWLQMFRASFQGLSGDILVRGESRVGFPHYEEMIRRLEERPEIHAAVPTLETFGLINLDNQIRDGVRVIGYPLERIGQVNRFWESLYLQDPSRPPAQVVAELEEELARQHERDEADLEQAVAEGLASSLMAREVLRSRQEHRQRKLAEVRRWAERREAGQPPTFEVPFSPEVYRDKMDEGRRRPRGAPDPAMYPGMIVATGVVGIRRDDHGGMYRWLGLEPDNPIWAKLLVLALDPDDAAVDIERQKDELMFWVIDNSRTGVFTTDQATVYVDFDILQRALRMTEQPIYGGFDPETFEPAGDVIGHEPARTNDIHVALAPGVSLPAGRQIVRGVVEEVLAEKGYDPRYPVQVETWEERYGDFLAAVEKERALVTVLFALISIVAIFLIFCIFYMIVAEKTKDIGIVKSVGATAGGIASVFLGYGAAIGIVGGALGVLLGGLFVRYINEIHDLMASVLGIEIWSAQTYMFDTIPNTVDPVEAAVILVVAVLASVVGAVVPAWRAARLRPVEALRFE